MIAFSLLIQLTALPILDLGEWDERFHANVAKNLIDNPLKPVLINDGILDLGKTDWSQTEIWLHKPPLALWFMAGGIKIFGTNELGVRFFSVIFSLFSIYFVYRIGRTLFAPQIGLTCALLYSINGLVYEVTSGRLAGDHVDALFLFLVQLIIFCVIDLKKNYTTSKLLVIGLLTGLAFMTKWTMVLFILPVVASTLLFMNRSIVSVFKALLIIILTGASISAPWIYYIMGKFPAEAEHILWGIITPFNNVVHEHGGSWYFYLDKIRICVNELVYLPMIFLLFKYVKRQSFERHVLVSWIFIPLLLLSLASTKREVYLLISVAPLCILIAYFIQYLFSIRHRIKYRWIPAVFTTLIFILSVRYSLERIKPQLPRFEKPEYRLNFERLRNEQYFGILDQCVIVNEPKYLQLRFYYNAKSYRYLNDSLIQEVKVKGYRVFTKDNGKYIEI